MQFKTQREKFNISHFMWRLETKTVLYFDIILLILIFSKICDYSTPSISYIYIYISQMFESSLPSNIRQKQKKYNISLFTWRLGPQTVLYFDIILLILILSKNRQLLNTIHYLYIHLHGSGITLHWSLCFNPLCLAI